jgi:hypothetical protein
MKQTERHFSLSHNNNACKSEKMIDAGVETQIPPAHGTVHLAAIWCHEPAQVVGVPC